LGIVGAVASAGRIRIGELSKRVGASPELLRAWETRYGLLEPERTAGGLRLYSLEDEKRVRLMRRHLDAGLAAAEAARLAKLDGAPPPPEPAQAAEVAATLERHLDELDEPGAQAVLDRLFAEFPLEGALADVLLPFLQRLGERWARAEITVAQEHFASNVVSGRLRALARGWGSGPGPRAVLACPPGEQHELGLLCFALALHERGWSITYLGTDTPLDDVAGALGDPPATCVVLAATSPQRFLDAADPIAALSTRVRVDIGGSGASRAVADELGTNLLDRDLVIAAAALAP
jgi:DNA-binding transcriptional MerR regulator